jgi:hypothetical protein
MRVSILIPSTTDWVDIANVTVGNAEKYCGRHGYSLFHNVFPQPNNGYNKIRKAIDVLDKGSDAVWVLDADALITNHTLRIERYLTPKKSFFITKDINGINCGSFVVKKSKWAISFLEWLLKCEGKEKMYCEQDAVNYYMALFPREVDTHFSFLNHPSINSYLYELYPEYGKQTHEQGQWQQGDFVLHLPGVGMEKRLEILKSTPIVR